ncbi:PP2C family protein-serine/threonine phosphatase [Planktotalea arctica]|uniref:PP2C family protein-serine/threonine phosphatase n=1 Tax=Planktotalea arctica TaxID=1481893 RepID=UPI003219B049
MNAIQPIELGVLEQSHLSKIKVLIVDDSRLQRRILSASLSRMGYEVREAEGGAQALEICEGWPPDLVLSDWMMPGMDGLEFCRFFKAMPREGYGYFILLTSKSAKDDVAQGLEGGADDFLTKPVNGMELRARLAAGERIIQMQRELTSQTKVISDTLDQLRAVHDSLNLDLIEAKKLQQSLVREKHKKFDRASLSFTLLSAGHVGGDLVGYFPISSTEVGFFAIDVSGHGVSSALMTARLAGYLTSPSPDQNIALCYLEDGTICARPPSDVIADLNRIVLEEMETDHYFTVILALANMETGATTLCQAGHPHPLVRRKDGRIEQDGTGGLPVGLFENVDFEEFRVQLEPGDQLILSSDGITECPDVEGNMLGEDGFERMVQKLSGSSGPQLLEALVWMLSEYAVDAGFPDDVSAVLYEFLPWQ